jgi:hypothetical protein
MPYTRFRYIAYQVPTVLDVNGAKLPTLDAGGEVTDHTIAPLVVDRNLPADARKRLKRLAAVVKLAQRIVNRANDDRGTLKVFMVPEFYFRPPNTVDPDYLNSTYTYDHAMQIFEAMNTMFVDAAFQDWLFVLGTVMWNWVDGNTIDYRNSAVHLLGHQADSLRLIEKDVPSHIDGVPDPWPRPWGRQAYDPAMEETFRDWSLRRGHVFDAGGVVCGLEVCLDHADPGAMDRQGRTHRVLKHVLSDWFANEPLQPAPAVALHLLTAGGMGISNGSVAATEGGYILRNDGFSQRGAGPVVELRKVLRYEHALPNRVLLPTGADDLAGRPVYGQPIQARWVECPDPLKLRIPQGWHGIEQGLHFYAPLDLPA